MATQIAGAVRLPDGTLPTHGRVIFRPRDGGRAGPPVISGAAVIAPISPAGAIDIELEAATTGTPYMVLVEHWSDGAAKLVQTALPDIVPTGLPGPFTIADLAVIAIPQGATSRATWKRGDTISIGGQWIDQHQRPLDLTGMAVTAAMRGPDDVIRPMAVTMIDAADGLLEILMSASTSAGLPIGEHAIDVKITVGVRVARTQTGFITIVPEVTP